MEGPESVKRSNTVKEMREGATWVARKRPGRATGAACAKVPRQRDVWVLKETARIPVHPQEHEQRGEQEGGPGR